MDQNPGGKEPSLPWEPDLVADDSASAPIWALSRLRARLISSAAIASVAAAHEKSPAQVLIRWSIQVGNVVLPGSSDPARIAENIDVFDFELTPTEVETINGLDDGTRFWPNPNS